MSSVIHPAHWMGLRETIDTSPMVIYHGSASDEGGIDLAKMRMKGLPGQTREVWTTITCGPAGRGEGKSCKR